MDRHHKEILSLIRRHSVSPTAHTFDDAYLGNSHPRYAINAPSLRMIAKEWMGKHREMDGDTFCKVLNSLIMGKSSTEKCMAGVLLDASRPAQRKFDPKVFDRWVDELVGWAEIDTLCTGAYAISEVPAQWPSWKKLLVSFSKSPNINKRRASLVFFCSPLRKNPKKELLEAALKNIDKLKSEKEIIITKAVSWVLRCGVIHHGAAIKKYVDLNEATLPKIAVRETRTKLKTGRKG